MSVPTALPQTAGANTVAFLAFIVVSLFILLIPVFIGIYVYKDAQKRGMNAPLWTLVAIFAPALVGLIIYLIVRTDNAQCPGCRAPVSESFTVCPRCGTALKDRCPGCGFRAEPDWKVCPQCAAPLPTEGRVSVPFEKRDKALSKVLLAVILVPILLFVLGVVAILLFRTSGNGVVSGSVLGTSYGLSPENYSDNPVVLDWFSQCEANVDGVYVLHYDDEQNSGRSEWLICIKGYHITDARGNYVSGLFSKPGLRGEAFGNVKQGETSIILIETKDYPESELGLTLNGKKQEYECLHVGFSLKP